MEGWREILLAGVSLVQPMNLGELEDPVDVGSQIWTTRTIGDLREHSVGDEMRENPFLHQTGAKLVR